jgi:hypothetical protein
MRCLHPEADNPRQFSADNRIVLEDPARDAHELRIINFTRWPDAFCARFLVGPDLNQAHPYSFEPLSALDDRLSFNEACDPGSFESRDVDKHVFAAAITRDEAVGPLGVEPLHRTGLLDTGGRRWAVRCRRRAPWRNPSGDAAMDAQHLRHVRSLVAGADSNFESIARLHGADAGPRQHTSVQESVAKLIGKFDETKPFLGAEPFDDCSDWIAGRLFESGLGEPGSSAESTRLWAIRIRVEVATPRMSEILVSQTSFLLGCASSAR